MGYNMNGLPKVMQRSGLDLHLTPVCPAEGTETYNKNIKIIIDGD
jgi:hypothetical protein